MRPNAPALPAAHFWLSACVRYCCMPTHREALHAHPRALLLIHVANCDALWSGAMWLHHAAHLGTTMLRGLSSRARRPRRAAQCEWATPTTSSARHGTPSQLAAYPEHFPSGRRTSQQGSCRQLLRSSRRVQRRQLPAVTPLPCQAGVEAFEAAHDAQNIALLCCNIAHVVRREGHALTLEGCDSAVSLLHEQRAAYAQVLTACCCPPPCTARSLWLAASCVSCGRASCV